MVVGRLGLVLLVLGFVYFGGLMLIDLLMVLFGLFMNVDLGGMNVDIEGDDIDWWVYVVDVVCKFLVNEVNVVE